MTVPRVVTMRSRGLPQIRALQSTARNVSRRAAMRILHGNKSLPCPQGELN